MSKKPITRNRKIRQTRKHRSFKWPMLTPRMTQIATGIALSMVVVGAFLWLKTWISKPDNLSIQQVDWQGDFRHFTRSELETLVSPYLSTNLYLLDADALEQALKVHEWVRSISLRKIWPSSLTIQVETQVPIAYWGEGRLLNQYGEIFQGELPARRGLMPMIYSPRDNGREMGERYVSLMQQLDGLGLEIIELTEDERGSWQIKLRNGPIVILGHKDQDKRLQRFRVGYVRELQSMFEKINRIDLRYTNGFAIEWKQSANATQKMYDLQRYAYREKQIPRSLGS